MPTLKVPVRRRADPSPPELVIEEFVHLERLPPLKYEIYSSAELVSNNGKRIALTMFLFESSLVFLGFLVTSKKKHSCFRKRPFKMSDLAPQN